MSGYLITWDMMDAEDVDMTWLWEHMGDPDYVVEDEAGRGYIVYNFPDLDGNNVPDFLGSGAGSGITNSQNIISG